MNILSLLLNTTKSSAGKAAIIENGQSISYQELWERIGKLSAGLYSIGIRENQRVAMVLPNSSEFIYCFFALFKLNAIISPLSMDMTPFEFKRIIDNLNPHAIIATQLFIDKVYQEYREIFHNRMLVLHGSAVGKVKIKNYYNLKQLFHLSGKISTSVGVANIETATINYTYRGFGYPLGAVLTHKNYYEGVLTYISSTRMASHHRVLSLLPLSHIYPLVGCMLAPLICGATVIISRNYMPRSIFQVIENCGINYFTAVPSIYNLLMRHYKKGEFNLSSLTTCISGGAYMPPEVQELIKSTMNLQILQGYGLTECFILTWNYYESNKAGTLGLPFARNIAIRIVDDNEMDMSRNKVGEVVIQSPSMMAGYYGQTEETWQVCKNGWFYTGDYGSLDDDGYLHFKGLKKNVAKVGGNLVDLEEVKNVLLSHPSILTASISVEEDDLLGHVVVAEVSAVDKRRLQETELKTYCRKYLAPYKVPKTVRFMAGVS